jgi:hypothetical protein
MVNSMHYSVESQPELPRETPQTASVLQVRKQRPYTYVQWVGIFNSINEVTYRFTCVTACAFANW